MINATGNHLHDAMLSTTAAYALRAMIHLATREGDGPVRVDEMADELELPRNYLSKVLHTLVKEGLLRSARGPSGGFELAAPSSSVTLYDVVRPFDTIETKRTCLLSGGECSDENPCGVHDRWSEVAADVSAFFRETVLGEVAGSPERVSAVLGP